MSPRPLPTARHRVEYGLYGIASGVLRAFPEGPAVALGAGLGWLAGAVLRIRRDVVEENLARAFPERDARWRRRIAVESYRHFGREAVVAFRLGRESAERVLARSDVHGLDALLEAASGPGAIVATGHLGNWEVAGGAVALRKVPIDAVAVRQRNPLFDDALVGNRRRLGIRVVYRDGAGTEVLRSVRAGRVPVLLADQDGGRSGVFVDFLGSLASTARGPALLALRSGAQLFGGVCLVEAGPPRRYAVHLCPLAVERTGDLAEDVRRLTRAHSDFLAGFVRQAPEQYFWQHKRWKTRPEPPTPERRPVRPV